MPDMHLRLLTFTSTILTMLVSAIALLPADAEANGHRKASGRYTVDGDASSLCSKSARSIEKIRAPFAGWLTVEVTFDDDWDLYLRNRDRELLAYSEHQSDTGEFREVIEYHVSNRETFHIDPCRSSGQSAAEVTWRLEEGRAWTAAVPAKNETHTERLIYRSPAVGAGRSFVICHVGFEVGCTATDLIAPTDRYVSVELDDQTSGDVWVELYQYKGSTGYAGDFFCTRTDKPIPLKPQTDWVGVAIMNGPCEDGTPAQGTTGRVTMTFSSHR